MAQFYPNLLNNLPAPWPTTLLPDIQQIVRRSRRVLVVLDDDPTGTQTVHQVPVLTTWGVPELVTELSGSTGCIYLLTNSRSLPQSKAVNLAAEIGRNLRQAVQETGQSIAVVSRSDSTLRGHFPAEVEALAAALGQPFDGWLLIPFFAEGRRVTLDDTHYVVGNGRLIPVAETEFARDTAFGYRSSNLREWVVEKSNGQIKADTITSISLDDLRCGGPDAVTAKLLKLTGGVVCVVNAVEYRDLEVFVAGLLAAEAQGKRYLYRTAASFVRVRAGLEPRPLLTSAELIPPDAAAGGLVVVGSYVPTTTGQLNMLLAQSNIYPIELKVTALLESGCRRLEIERVARQVETALTNGADVVIYTSRRLVSGTDAVTSLSVGKIVSESLVAVVQAIGIRPRYIVAKGGITSSDVATGGLGVKRALVLGQILPGVPVWQTGPESRFPGVPYVIFPGNVGGPTALLEVIQALSKNGGGEQLRCK